jgi:D-3-phosphoglycerate dehydrogenase
MRVLVADPVAEDGIALLRTTADVDVATKLSEDELVARVADADALVVRSETKVTARVLDAGRRLQVVGRAGVGVDNIDVDAATRRGVYVVNAPTGNIVAVAELTVALMLGLLRGIAPADAHVRAGEWKRSQFIGREARGKTLGLVGLGRIGSEVAKRAAALEMRLLAHDPYATEAKAQSLGVTLVGLDDLLTQSDVITVHAPLTPDTRDLIGRDAIARMKRGAFLVNAARGELVDEAALADALAAGRLGGVALDVFAQEPPKESPILAAPRTLLTPHIAGSTAEAQVNVAVDVARQVLDVLAGRPAASAVNAPRPPADEAGGARWLLLAERLGALAAQLIAERPAAVEITYRGGTQVLEPEALRAAVMKGALETWSDERVNLVNALSIARSRGLTVAERREATSTRYPALLEVRLGGTAVGGALVAGEPRILFIDGFWVDVPIAGHLLLTRHQDKPGLVGRVGTLLGESDVNISSMQVGRLHARGDALMILTLDDPVPASVRDRIAAYPDMNEVRVARLGV